MSLELVILSIVILQMSISRESILQVRKPWSIFVPYIQLTYSEEEKAMTRFVIAAIINFIRYFYVLVFTTEIPAKSITIIVLEPPNLHNYRGLNPCVRLFITNQRPLKQSLGYT
jgi:hypothetical protein